MLHEQLQKVRRSFAASRATLEELEAASEERWEELKGEAENVWKALRHSINYFRSQL